jgi:lipoate-protein ligase A
MLLLIDRTLPTAEENLALDEALTASLDQGRGTETLRFWESPRPVVVLGNSSKIQADVHIEACARDQVPILRRASGGGTVVLGPGCLNFALVLSLEKRPDLRDVRRSYTWILGGIARALGLDGLEIRGVSDLAWNGRKVSGNAQRRTRTALLHQGTILYALDPGLATQTLREPSRQPAYRQGRHHAAFLGNVPMTSHAIKDRFVEVWEAVPAGSNFVV